MRCRLLKTAVVLLVGIICLTVFLSYPCIITKRSSSSSHSSCCPESDRKSKETFLRRRQLELDSNDANNSFPNEVFYIWCPAAGYYFEYRHYLSVRSVFEHLNPFRVTFYYEHAPTVDKNSGYNTWFTELEEQFPFFTKQHIPQHLCSKRLSELLDEDPQFTDAGLYVREDVVIGSRFAELLQQASNQNLDMFSVETVYDKRLVWMKRRQQKNSESRSVGSRRHNVSLEAKVINGNGDNDRAVIKMLKRVSETPTHEINRIISLIIDEPVLLIAKSYFDPEDIWELDGAAGRLLRHAAYGTPDFARPVPDYNTLAPNIAHVIWSNDDPMDFQFYLCALSLIHVALVDRLYIHGDGPPTGFYWNLIKDNPKIRIVRRRLINRSMETVYGNRVAITEHITDVWRADIMFRYGGLYVDTDVMFVRPTSREMRAYDAVLSKDVGPYWSFPAVYQNGIMLGKPGAPFWRLYLETMKVVIHVDGDWMRNSTSGFQLYKINERCPKFVRDDSHLSTTCNHGRCFPSWIPDFHEQLASHLETGSMKFWWNTTYGVHHTHPDLVELSNPEALLADNGTTVFSQIALYTYCSMPTNSNSFEVERC